MKPYFNLLNRFGQPTLEWAKNIKPSKPLKMNSIDDFNKYFDKKLFKSNNKLEKTPKQDTFITNETDSLTNLFQNRQIVD